MSENPAAEAPRSPNLLIAAIALLVLIALMGAFLIGSQRHQTSAAPVDSATVGVLTNGQGSVTATPDQLTFSVTVTNQAAQTSDAMRETNAGVRAVTSAVKKAGVLGKDIQTTNISIQPVYNYSGSIQRIIGYTSTQQLQVLVRSLSTAGTVMSAAATAAGNTVSIDSVALSIGNQTDLTAQARAKAVTDSRRAAQALATAAGRDLGDLVYVEEVPSSDGVIQYPLALDAIRGAQSAKAPIPVSPGQQKVTVNVKVRWSLK